MTAAEMKTLFLTLYDAATSLGAPGWEDDEISSFLSKAQLDIIEFYYNKKDYKTIGDVVMTLQLPISGTEYHDIPNSVFTDISDAVTGYEMLYFINSYVDIQRTNPTISSTERVPVEIIDVESAPKLFQTTLNKVWFLYPKGYILSTNGDVRHLVVLVDSYTTTQTNAYITFVRKPVDIVIGTSDSELGVGVHKELVEKAVEEAVKSVRVAKITNQ